MAYIEVSVETKLTNHVIRKIICVVTMILLL